MGNKLKRSHDQRQLGKITTGLGVLPSHSDSHQKEPLDSQQLVGRMSGRNNCGTQEGI